jgi:hypothetical protein
MKKNLLLLAAACFTLLFAGCSSEQLPVSEPGTRSFCAGTDYYGIDISHNYANGSLTLEWSIHYHGYYTHTVVFRNNLPIAVIPAEPMYCTMGYQYTVQNVDNGPNAVKYNYRVTAAIGDSVIQPEHGTVFSSRNVYFPPLLSGDGDDPVIGNPDLPIIP